MVSTRHVLRLALRRIGYSEDGVMQVEATAARIRRQGLVLTARRIAEYYLTPMDLRDALVEQRRAAERDR